MTDEGSKRNEPFDYLNANIDELRAAAAEVERRIDGKEVRGQQAGEEGDAEDRAARVLQSSYSNYRGRRDMHGAPNIRSSERWTDGLRARERDKAGAEQKQGKNDAASRWKRSEVYANKISEGSAGSKNGGKGSEPTVEEEMQELGRTDKERKRVKQEREVSKNMEGTYWLEIVDPKHRYASNLKYYHAKWSDTDTDQNFFHWLDDGDGKDVELEECSRARLDKETITFLNVEQRTNYKVDIDEKGLLRWKKDGKPVDTSKFHRDAGPDKGIVEISKEECAKIEAAAKERRKKIKENGGEVVGSSSSSSSSSDQADEIREGTRAYDSKGGTAGAGKGLGQMKARVKYYSSPRAVMDHALRETLNKNTWIFVADLKGNLYVGIKKTGGFQHSSFLSGARVTAAGLIKVNQGKLSSLSPLSGHYRAGTMHFKAFVRKLEEQHVDMSNVSISKSILTIRGIEKYGSAMKKKKRITSKIKKLFTGDDKSSEEEEREKDARDREMVQQKHREHGDEQGKLEHSGGDRPDELKLAELSLDKPLPGDGKSKEEMDDDERLDRGVALMQRAFERGLLLNRGDGDGK